VGAGEWIHTRCPGCGGNFSFKPGPKRGCLQEGVAWFDDLSQARGVRGTVTVDSR
jgi:hypothetical protein